MKRNLLTLIVMISFGFFANAQNEINPTYIARAVYMDTTPPLRDMPVVTPGIVDRSWKNGIVKNMPPRQAIDTTPVIDPVVQRHMGKWINNNFNVNINGISNINGVMPPDTDGDVGPNHYFQMINLSFQIFNKTGGSLYGPVANSTLWNGFPGAWTGSNDGDPIIMYDEYSNRWIATQFALPYYPNGPFWEMIAVSMTPDPTGQWYRYAFQFADMPDYPKLAVWHNAYLMSINRFTSGSGNYTGVGAVAFERAKMLTGDPTAQMVVFTYPSSAEPYSFLPADADGTAPPANAPAYFAYMNDFPDKIVIYKMVLDWTNTTNSTFSLDQSLTTASFASGISGIVQPGTTRKLDALSDRLMYRLQYRNFGTYQTMVTNHTVNLSNVAGIRWYEFRKSGTAPWSIYQQGTYSPDNTSRWMGSIAMDAAGNIALGYSVSSSTVYPGIRYTGRMANDPLGEMTIAETTIVDGGGSQTGGLIGNGRWGDYSSMSVDPSTPNTFWFSTEYMQFTSSQAWKTRIASFTFQSVFTATLSASPDSICSGQSSVISANVTGSTGTVTYAWTSLPAGFTSTSASVTVNPTTTTSYICSVVNGTNTIIDTITVVVNLPPTASAGVDAAICQTTPFTTQGTASNYKKTVWTSTGDGSFNDPGLLNAIYTPGTLDAQNGSTKLILTANALAGCSENAKDTMNLTVRATPVVMAGIDTTICYWEFPFTTVAEVTNGENYVWTSFGDGVFVNPYSITATYSPGPTDLINGSVNLKLSASAISPCTGNYSDEMTLILDPCVGINENENLNASVVINPNPNDGKFTISITGIKDSKMVMQITNALGQEIYKQEVSAKNQLQTELDLSKEKSGVYVLKITAGTKSLTRKIIRK